MTRWTPFTIAGMMFGVIAVVLPIAFIAQVTLRQETRERVAPIVMVIFFDDTDDLVRWRGHHEDQHVRRVNRHDFDLVARECLLERL